MDEKKGMMVMMIFKMRALSRENGAASYQAEEADRTGNELASALIKIRKCEA
ncbi:hypothetical protein [Nitrobacter sp. TKz-YC01]|uniref:hypothetical protein n=1 Tax=Nitrobacter sp. TKz-YC01 TaxID=3398703 RepID=UPI003A102130